MPAAVAAGAGLGCAGPMGLEVSAPAGSAFAHTLHIALVSQLMEVHASQRQLEHTWHTCVASGTWELHKHSHVEELAPGGEPPAAQGVPNVLELCLSNMQMLHSWFC